MSTKTLIAGLIGGVASFLMGWLLFGILFRDMIIELSGMQGIMRQDSELIMWALILGNLSMGMFTAYIFATWTSISTFMTGLRVGAVIGFLMSLGWNMVDYATTNIYQLNGALLGVALSVVMGGVVGGVVGYWLGRK
ncbi:MAG: hypothetical protein IPH93_02215 [Saprospiraceae bacterium]|nr:hypothetical protein [Saprospiraceae bacterium]